MNKYYCPVNWENCYFPWQFRDQDYKKQHKLLTWKIILSPMRHPPFYEEKYCRLYLWQGSPLPLPLSLFLWIYCRLFFLIQNLSLLISKFIYFFYSWANYPPTFFLEKNHDFCFCFKASLKMTYLWNIWLIYSVKLTA